MAKAKKIKPIKIHYDSIGNTLNVWFDDPQREYISEETGEEVILNKNRQGKVIGFEKLNFLSSKNNLDALPLEVMI